MKLPDINGIEVCRILKQDIPTILVLQMSASFVEAKTGRAASENGADFIPRRACRAGELIATVRALMRMRDANEALRASEERYRVIVESATDYAIFTIDLDGLVTSWNAGAQNVLGYEEGEIVGQDSPPSLDAGGSRRGSARRGDRNGETDGEGGGRAVACPQGRRPLVRAGIV